MSLAEQQSILSLEPKVFTSFESSEPLSTTLEQQSVLELGYEYNALSLKREPNYLLDSRTSRTQKAEIPRQAEEHGFRPPQMSQATNRSRSGSGEFSPSRDSHELKHKTSQNSVKQNGLSESHGDETEGDDSRVDETNEVLEKEKERRRLRNQKRKARRMKAKKAINQEKNKSSEEEDSTEVIKLTENGTLDSIFDDDLLLTDPDSSNAPDTPTDSTPPPGSKGAKSLSFDTKNVLVSTYETDGPSTTLDKSERKDMSDRKVSIEETIRLNRKKSLEFSTAASQEAQNPFDLIKLRPTTKSTMNSKYAEKLPAIHPVKTIIGLSHKQILNLDLSDVKLKTIIQLAKISKYASTALSFTSNHNDELFANDEKRKIFILLCINVALYESIGFKKTVKVYPNILELFGGYSEINLENTRTKLTPSNRDIHQNNLDYSVLSYIGHILIWAAHQQRQGGVETFAKDYDLTLPASLVRETVGGYHLWDRLIREPSGMNAKRWKHIIKFRLAFPYEEDQFMLILRFMKINSDIP